MPVSPTKVLYRPASNTGNDLTGAVMRDLGEQSVAPAGDYVPWAMAADPNGAITIGAAPTAPAQMSAPTVTATGSDSISVDLAAAPADGGSAITSYDLRYSTDETNWTEVSDVSDPQTVSGLTASTLYYVQTRAVNAVDADPSNWSTSGTAATDAAAGSAFDVSYLAYGDSGHVTDSAPAGNYTVSGISFGAADADRSIVAICHTNYTGTGASTNGEITAVTIGGQSATKIVAQRADGIEVSAWIAAVPTGTSGDVVATMNGGMNRFAASTFRVIDGETGDTASATVSITTSPVSLDVNTSVGGAVIAAVQTKDATTALSFTGTTKSYENDIRTNERAAAGLATGVTAETPRTVSVSASVTLSHGIAFALSEAAG